jgi:Family of unknown function (DUF6515)
VACAPFRESEFRAPRFLDRRFHHDHHYSPCGFVFGALPPRFHVVVHGGVRYYFANGVWYWLDAPGRNVWVIPPVGIVVPVLPPSYTTIWMSGVPYYYANGAYYTEVADGYQVVPPPPSSVVIEQGPAPSTGAQPTSASSVVELPPSNNGGASVPFSNNVAQLSSSQVFMYPRGGQRPDQLARDRSECEQWASAQTGYDPPGPSSGAQGERAQKLADYNRALAACLEGQGYTVR